MADDTAKRNPGRAGILAATTAVLVLLLTGPARAASVTVDSVNFRFQPESQTVGVGDVVRWTFSGDPHTVTSGVPGTPDGRFDSGFKDPGESFQVTFDTAGTFPYFCQVHPVQMVGSIVVEAAATPAPTAKPTPKPTPTPTPKPTASPTARPTATPTAAPSEASTPTPAPAPTAPPTASPIPTPTPTPPSASPSPTPAPSVSPPPSAETSAAPAVDDDATASSLDIVSILAIAIVVGLLVAGGVAFARRPRAG